VGIEQRDYKTWITRPGLHVDSPIDEAAGSCQGCHRTTTSHWHVTCTNTLSLYQRLPVSAGPPGARASAELRTPGWRHISTRSPVNGFDPTNNIVDERYVRVAVGRDYADVAPTRGVTAERPRANSPSRCARFPSIRGAFRYRRITSESTWTPILLWGRTRTDGEFQVSTTAAVAIREMTAFQRAVTSSGNNDQFIDLLEPREIVDCLGQLGKTADGVIGRNCLRRCIALIIRETKMAFIPTPAVHRRYRGTSRC